MSCAAKRLHARPPQGDNGRMVTVLDHLVVMAASLAEGEHWCERHLGLKPGPGGRHALMGTHNRLLNIASPAYPDAYLEIIAIEPGAVPERTPGTRRWFDMDDPELRCSIEQDGPRLVHWVARTDDIEDVGRRWRALGIDRGPPLAAERRSAQGLLQWRITVRDDGARLFEGCLPTLIQWGSQHPAHAMSAQGLALSQLRITHPSSVALSAAWQEASLSGVTLDEGVARIEATLLTPRGPVILSSLTASAAAG